MTQRQSLCNGVYKRKIRFLHIDYVIMMPMPEIQQEAPPHEMHE
jgi:hypothetical protein